MVRKSVDYRFYSINMSNSACPCCMKSLANPSRVSVLHELCKTNNFTEVCNMISLGENVNTIFYSNYSTPLHVAATSGSKETVLVLLCHGAFPDIFNKDKKTALHLVKIIQAIAEKHLEIAKILLDFNCTPCECHECQNALDEIIQGTNDDDNDEMDFEKELENLRPLLQGKLVNKLGEIIDINK